MNENKKYQTLYDKEKLIEEEVLKEVQEEVLEEALEEKLEEVEEKSTRERKLPVIPKSVPLDFAVGDRVRVRPNITTDAKGRPIIKGWYRLAKRIDRIEGNIARLDIDNWNGYFFLEDLIK